MTAATETKKITGWDEKFEETYGIKSKNGVKSLTKPVLFQLHGVRKPKPRVARTKSGKQDIFPFRGEYAIQGWCYYTHKEHGPGRLVLNSMTDVFNWKKDELPAIVDDIVFLGGDFWVTPETTNWEQVLLFLHYHPQRLGSPCADKSKAVIFEYINELERATNIQSFIKEKVKIQNKLVEMSGDEVLQRCSMFNINVDVYDISNEEHVEILRGHLIKAVDAFFETKDEISKQNLVRDWDNELQLIAADVTIARKLGVIEYVANGRIWKWGGSKSLICATPEGMEANGFFAEYLFEHQDTLEELRKRIKNSRLESEYEAQSGQTSTDKKAKK